MSRHLHTILRHAAAPADDRPDADLLGGFLHRRDEHAFAALVRRHGPMVWGVCRNLLATDADAEDAFQATFLALVRDGRRVRRGDRLAAWLHGVAVRVALRVRRTAARRRHHEATAAAPEAAAPAADWHEVLAAVHEEVGRLPDRLRVAFVLCCLEGRRQADAAAELGLKPNTLTARLGRARQQLLDRLTRRGIAPVAAVGAAATGAAGVPPALAARTLVLSHAAEAASPAVLQLARGAFDMTTRTKWLAAALVVTAAMTTTVATKFFADADGQSPPGAGGFAGGGGMGGGGSRSTARGPAPAATPTGRWEYKVVTGLFGHSGTEAQLNKLGDDGWELAATPTERNSAEAVFKRPKSRLRPVADGGPPVLADPILPPVDDGTLPRVAGPTAKPAAAKEPSTTVIALKYAQATQLQPTLSTLLNLSMTNRVSISDRVKMAADARTNSLIVITDDATLKTIKELLEKLDVPDSPPNKPTK